MMTGIELVEVLAEASRAAAFMDDPKYCGSNSVVYVAARLALRAAIVEAYPGANAEKIIDTWIDCGESIAYCADYTTRQAQEEAREDGRINLEILIEDNPQFQ